MVETDGKPLPTAANANGQKSAQPFTTGNPAAAGGGLSNL